jgi:hypothetical protein
MKREKSRVFLVRTTVPQRAIAIAQKVEARARTMKFTPVTFAALILLTLPILGAQTPAPPPGPVPAPIQSAQKIFIANGGMDAFSLQAFEELGLAGTNAYDSLYAAVKSWPKYQLVSSPADADLVLSIRLTAPLTNVGEHGTWDFQHILANTTWQFQIEVTIYDAKTHFALWTLTEPVRPANLAGTWRKNIASANTALTGDLKTVLSPTP